MIFMIKKLLIYISSFLRLVLYFCPLVYKRAQVLEAELSLYTIDTD